MFIAMAGGGISNFAVVALGALYGTPLEIANPDAVGLLFSQLSAFGVFSAASSPTGPCITTRVAAIGFAPAAFATLAVGMIDLGNVGLVRAMASCRGSAPASSCRRATMIVRAVTPPGAFGKVFASSPPASYIGGVIAPPILRLADG